MRCTRHANRLRGVKGFGVVCALAAGDSDVADVCAGANLKAARPPVEYYMTECQDKLLTAPRHTGTVVSESITKTFGRLTFEYRTI
jgi:hypothetical protein